MPPIPRKPRSHPHPDSISRPGICTQSQRPYLLDKYPSLRSTTNNHIRNVGKNPRKRHRMRCGHLGNYSRTWVDHEFCGYHGCVLERVAMSGKQDILEMLPTKGADAMRDGGSGAGAGEVQPWMLELTVKHDSRRGRRGSTTSSILLVDVV